MFEIETPVPVKADPPPELAIQMPDGRKIRLSPDVIVREHLRAGMRTPFTGLPIVSLGETAARSGH